MDTHAHAAFTATPTPARSRDARFATGHERMRDRVADFDRIVDADAGPRAAIRALAAPFAEVVADPPHEQGDIGWHAHAGAGRNFPFETHWTRILHVDLFSRRLRDGEGDAPRPTAIVRLVVAAANGLRALRERHRQRRAARLARDALQELDDHMLRDLGISRDEVDSLAAEAAGLAERTRIRAMVTMYDASR